VDGIGHHTDSNSTKKTIEEATKAFGKTNVLINNVGYSILGAAENNPEAEAKAKFEVNL
jgi:NADP-dependent 3-hydroxy acid dehydrogenase YdfG